jgi:flagellar protein FlbD
VPGGEKVLCSLPANRCPRMPMITLTRLNGQPFVVNAEKIRYVEETPDTIVCTENGDRLMVKEPMQVVIKKAIEYARLIRRPITE